MKKCNNNERRYLDWVTINAQLTILERWRDRTFTGEVPANKKELTFRGF
jgi:hypothetical protein